VRLAIAALLACAVAPVLARADHVNVITLEGAITSASYEYLRQSIDQSEQEGAEALLVELDTPGGVLGATQQIVKELLNAEVPVIIYVSPQGAWAASAGAIITIAGHVAAMSPGTSIGAASPITAGGQGGERNEDDERTDVAMEKVEKFTTAFIESIAKERDRNVEWAARAVREAEAITADEALELGVVDYVARNRKDLFEQMQGRVVAVSGEDRTLELAGLDVRRIEMTLLTRFLTFIAQPEIAGLLLLAGMAGLYMEFQQPGLIVPGVTGLICLILAAIALQILPFSWVGLLLIAAGIGLMVGEIFVTSYGILLVAGAGCLLLGGSMLFDVPEVSGISIPFWTLLVPVVGSFVAFAGLVIYALGRSFTREQAAGVGELVGLVGRAATGLAPDGKVFVRGEYWNAEADDEIANGEKVEITAVEGLRLRVRRAAPQD
jgi:membrane-bound serine protease (ClpP class)